MITCLGILVVTYLFRSKKDVYEGQYNQVDQEADSSKEMEFENDVEKNNGNNDDDNNITTTHQQLISTESSSSSFKSYICQQLQFDYRVAGLAGLYVLQKQFLYLAMSNLDAAVFQVTYQIKTLLTAVFSVVLLKRKLTSMQIIALVILTVGVGIVQLDKVDENASVSYQEQSRWVGVLACLGASCTSGFGGVYFELVLKPRTDGDGDKSNKGPPRPEPSVWAKNVQLSTFGLIIALVTAYSKDGRAILTEGFFQGYTSWVVAVIAFQAMGGLIVAAVIKYADNILKSFAAAMSIVGSTIVSAHIFHFQISQLFMAGCILQFVSIYLYAKKPPMSGKEIIRRTSELVVLQGEELQGQEKKVTSLVSRMSSQERVRQGFVLEALRRKNGFSS